MRNVCLDHLAALPARPDDAHKGVFGTAMLFAGSSLMPGAAALCARSAFRAGVGLVRLVADAWTLQAALAIEPSATGVRRPPSGVEWRAWLGREDPHSRAAVAFGPGLGEPRRWVPFLGVLDDDRRPLVVDADGLNALALRRLSDSERTGPWILTPHPGEFRRLADAAGVRQDPTDPKDRPAAAGELARRYRAVVLLKGRATIVSDGDRVYCNDTGNPALATAGSGDVLTGLIVALLAQGLEAFDAAAWGAWIHGRAADRWAERHGRRGLLARELADELPAAFADAARRSSDAYA